METAAEYYFTIKIIFKESFGTYCGLHEHQSPRYVSNMSSKHGPPRGCAKTQAHTPSAWGQGPLRRCSVVHTLRQPVVRSQLLVISHHTPLLAPVSGFPNLFHLARCAIYTLLLLTSKKRRQAGRDRRERKTEVKCSRNAQDTSVACRQETFPFPVVLMLRKF